MMRITKRSFMLLLVIILLVSLPQVTAAVGETKKVYEVTYSSEDLSTPMDWYNSDYFNDPDYKENRFVQYWVQTPIAPGGPRDTGFYMVYNEEGLNIFFQSNESERDQNGILKTSQIELFMQTGQGDLPYHQMIIHMDGTPHEYYEWQTEYRDNRPFQGDVTVTTEEIPTGWGTVLFVPWETVYDYVPLNGENWEFSMIRWSPSNSPTWGGNVHQPGKFNVLQFQAPTTEQRSAIQKNIISSAWQKFNETSTQLSASWLNGDVDDADYFYNHVQPLITEGQAKGSSIPNLDSLSAVEMDALYQQVESWFELRFDAEKDRISYIKNSLFNENKPPTTTDSTYATLKNSAVSGVVIGSDADGDALTYTLSTPPAHGSVAVEVDGHWTYTPNENYTGSDQFKVIVTDTWGGSATSTINLMITSGPETTAILAPALPNGSNGWYKSDVSVTLETSDAMSGVKKTEYRINNGDWKVYSNTFMISAEGVHLLEYRGIDNSDNAESLKSVTIKIDKTAPLAAVSLSKTVLSPPNHKMVPIIATLTKSDAISGIASFELTSITSNEADNGAGDGNTTNDIENAAFGTPDTSFSLRAERSGGGSGRIYTVTYTITDNAGQTSAASATVSVPKGNGNN